jgi:hypothetical protein
MLFPIPTTRQQAFDQAMQHMIGQGQKCVGSRASCVNANRHGLQCAIGCQQPYDTGQFMYPKLYKSRNELTYGFLSTIRHLHDHHTHWDKYLGFIGWEAARALCRGYNLKWNFAWAEHPSIHRNPYPNFPILDFSREIYKAIFNRLHKFRHNSNFIKDHYILTWSDGLCNYFRNQIPSQEASRMLCSTFVNESKRYKVEQYLQNVERPNIEYVSNTLSYDTDRHRFAVELYRFCDFVLRCREIQW